MVQPFKRMTRSKKVPRPQSSKRRARGPLSLSHTPQKNRPLRSAQTSAECSPTSNCRSVTGQGMSVGHQPPSIERRPSSDALLPFSRVSCADVFVLTRPLLHSP